jgi:hypothetical protein
MTRKAPPGAYHRWGFSLSTHNRGTLNRRHQFFQTADYRLCWRLTSYMRWANSSNASSDAANFFLRSATSFCSSSMISEQKTGRLEWTPSMLSFLRQVKTQLHISRPSGWLRASIAPHRSTCPAFSIGGLGRPRVIPSRSHDNPLTCGYALSISRGITRGTYLDLASNPSPEFRGEFRGGLITRGEGFHGDFEGRV